MHLIGGQQSMLHVGASSEAIEFPMLRRYQSRQFVYAGIQNDRRFDLEI